MQLKMCLLSLTERQVKPHRLFGTRTWRAIHPDSGYRMEQSVVYPG